jgi:hypothetical protein
MTYEQAYVALYESFVYGRGLDENDTYWSEQTKAEFAAAFQKLQEAYNKKPL